MEHFNRQLEKIKKWENGQNQSGQESESVTVDPEPAKEKSPAVAVRQKNPPNLFGKAVMTGQ